jgi:tetratricopeptide (TPR) repeat protein
VLKLGVAGAFAALGLVAAPAAQAACEFQKVAEVPVTMRGLQPLVHARINGHDTTFILDTGAFFSAVSDDAVARFGMKKSSVPMGLMIRSVGGATTGARAATADMMEFAGGHFSNMQFLAGGRIGDGEVAGVIGQNLLGNYDMEYDLANGVLRFFQAKDCRGANLAYWSAGKALSSVDLREVGDNPKNINRLVTAAKINGKTIRVNFDSGSSMSFVSRPTAAKAGVPISSEGVTAAGVTYGVFGSGQETFLAPFASFAIGAEEIKNTQLRVSDIQLGDSEMLIGADFFLSHRILVAKSQGKIYFTYNGGPVFRLDRNPDARPATVADAKPIAPPASAPATTPSAALTTGAEYHRRGQASMARRDFMGGVADFTKAIELEPSDATHYHARALARLGAGQPVLAMADLGEALKRDPNDVEALMLRGRLYLASKDPDRGQADFDAALKLAPTNNRLPMEIGLSYAGAGLFQAAVRQFDSWIAAHPADLRVPQVQAARCFTRAAWGQELEAALVDCDAALKKDRVSQAMEARGLVLLRLGRTDEAISQFAAALKAQPKAAGALYGRGLAQLTKGAKAEGEADIAAAKSLEPRQIEQYARWGLTPEALAKPTPAA